jgi:hypothetical protein
MSNAEPMAAAPARHPWLRVILAAVAAIEFADALSGLTNIFLDYHHDTAYLRFAQALLSVKLALAPLVAGAALVFAVAGRLRAAIVALAALVLLSFVLDDVWSIPLHGFELTPDFGGLTAFAYYIAFPLAAVAAIVLALKDRHLALATALVCVPTVFNWLGVAAFAIGVMIYGF